MDNSNFNKDLLNWVDNNSNDMFSEAEAEQFKNKLSQLQLNCESDFIRKRKFIESNYFNSKEQELFDKLASIISTGFFGTKFYSSI